MLQGLLRELGGSQELKALYFNMIGPIDIVQ